jgi:SAM-dependent methyltransferase
MQLKKIIKDFIPPVFLKLFVKKQVAPYKCPVCKSNVPHFLRLHDYPFEMMDRYQYVHSIFCSETFNFLNYSCPSCYSSDRSRLYAIYLNVKFQEYAKTGERYTLLDIAPDKTLGNWIKSYSIVNYRSVDLYMEGTDDKADITNLNIYENDRFDIILCSHVLEHVSDDRKALAELYRVLRHGGFAIVMVPILLTIENDLENPLYSSEADRWKYYGQNDHVRMYSKKGFIEKLQHTGFKVNQFGIDFFGPNEFEKYGIHPRSVLYIVEK